VLYHCHSHSFSRTAGAKAGSMLEDWLIYQVPSISNFIMINGDPHSQKHLHTHALETITSVACQNWANTEADRH